MQVSYGLKYEEVDIQQLSPGTRGIVLLLLYLSIDTDDQRSLIIDQPDCWSVRVGYKRDLEVHKTTAPEPVGNEFMEYNNTGLVITMSVLV